MERQDNRFFNGFIVGLIIGAAAVFLFGTEKGKKILKTISDEGLEKLSDLIEESELGEDILEEVEPVDEVVEEPEIKTEEKTEKKSPKKRFFRRVRK